MKDITITAEQVEKMLKKYRKLEKEYLNTEDAQREKRYELKMMGMEYVFNIIGIEY